MLASLGPTGCSDACACRCAGGDDEECGNGSAADPAGRSRAGCRPHPTAFFGAAPACGGAILAVLGLMLRALVAARLANLGTYLTKGFGKLATSRHESRLQTANLSAVHVEHYTARHHLHILFMQAGRRTHVACVGAGIAGSIRLSNLTLIRITARGNRLAVLRLLRRKVEHDVLSLFLSDVQCPRLDLPVDFGPHIVFSRWKFDE